MSRFWAGGAGPTRSAIEGALQSAGRDPSQFVGNKEVVVRQALASGSDQQTIDLLHELGPLLADEGVFQDADPDIVRKVRRLRDALGVVAGDIDDEGVIWLDELDVDFDDHSSKSGFGAPVATGEESEPMTPVSAEFNNIQAMPDPGPSTSVTPTIFIVHGHDDGLRDTVEIQLRRWINPVDVIILDQQASRGRTLVEKFEAHAESAQFAIVLATPDDEGGKRGTQMQPRARQNVVFEMGYFFGKLGRGRVVIVDAGVEHPSDVDGVLYISRDAPDWRQRLARELDAAKIRGNWLN